MPATARDRSPLVLILAVGLTLVLVVAAVILAVSLTGSDDRRSGAAPGPDGACRGSNVTLEQAAGRFGLRLPDDPQDVHYLAQGGGLSGQHDLQLRFRTTAAGLKQFLSASGFGALGPDVQALRVGEPPADPCRRAAGGLAHARYAGDHVPAAAGHGAYNRGVAVDDSDPAHPVVALVALDG
ncbi:hypothetical protein ABZ461_06195 [Actinacidiphila glaucinigra]|uniref:hypothetical protein n=1 Tax=Actinacidiphila glaucinigra TaxID=235986 RepID=UPI002E2EB159|nr:hypothetical protein [Actinacidiphila glaucinigra]